MHTLVALGVRTVLTRNSAIAATLPGLIPNGVLLTRIVATPGDGTSFDANYRRSPPFGRCREEPSLSLDASWHWPPNEVC